MFFLFLFLFLFFFLFLFLFLFLFFFFFFFFLIFLFFLLLFFFFLVPFFLPLLRVFLSRPALKSGLTHPCRRVHMSIRNLPLGRYNVFNDGVFQYQKSVQVGSPDVDIQVPVNSEVDVVVVKV